MNRYFLDGRDHPKRYRTRHLIDIVVDDHVHSHATELAWFTIAVTVIAKRERKSPEQVFADINAACFERTARYLNPLVVHPGELV